VRRALYALGALALTTTLVLWAGAALREPLGWRWSDIPATGAGAAPASCEAAALLNQWGANRPLLALADSPPLTPEQAQAQAEAAVRAVAGGPPLAASAPLRADVTIAGDHYAYLHTFQMAQSALADQPGTRIAGPALIVLTGEGAPRVLAVAAAGVPEESCPFPWRDWAVETVRRPETLLAGAIAGGLVLAALSDGLRRMRRRGKAVS